MFGFSSSELVLVALIVGLVLLAGRVGGWGEALGRLGARSRTPAPGPGARPGDPGPPPSGG
ncbi:MAG TPA: hypothetical protein VFS43_37380 [Polyangiaceae bacterium]|nr:hypothetical protein [Polyangiaceae bacterium]